MRRSRLRFILGATAMMVVVAAVLVSAILITRSPSVHIRSQGTSAAAAPSGSSSPSTRPITPRFSRSAAEAAARKSSSGIAREESKLTTWGFASSYADAVVSGASDPASVASSSPTGVPVSYLPTPLTVPESTKGSSPASVASGQDVWLVALSGKICCEFGQAEPSPWAIYVYNATTGTPMSVLYGPPSSSATWPPDFDSIQDLAAQS
jgi:hypothetical protein